MATKWTREEAAQWALERLDFDIVLYGELDDFYTDRNLQDALLEKVFYRYESSFEQLIEYKFCGDTVQDLPGAKQFWSVYGKGLERGIAVITACAKAMGLDIEIDAATAVAATGEGA